MNALPLMICDASCWDEQNEKFYDADFNFYEGEHFYAGENKSRKCAAEENYQEIIHQTDKCQEGKRHWVVKAHWESMWRRKILRGGGKHAKRKITCTPRGNSGRGGGAACTQSLGRSRSLSRKVKDQDVQGHREKPGHRGSMSEEPG